jgi:ribosome-associated toxin RatA of RatAB toxin-antitoxin module
MFFVLATAYLCAPQAWEEVDNDDGIRVWAREVEGSGIREVRGTVTIPVATERILEVLEDVSRYPEFMPYVEKTEIVERHSQGHWEYQLLDPPLVSRRDYTVKITIQREGDTVRRTWKSDSSKGPKAQDGVVRVTVNQGEWTLHQKAPSETQLTYYLYTDPGGSIPRWIANKANTTSVPDLLNAVRNRSVDGAWRR